MEWCQGSEFFFAKKPACKFTIIYHPPVLWKTMIVYICMTMEIKKWKLFISFPVLKTSKAEKNSSQPFGPSKKAIFSRQINPRRLGKPNGVHHELSRNRATGCSSKFWILLSSVFCPKLAWTPCRWSIGASVWDTWGVVGEVGIPRPGITERAYASLASLQTVIFASKVTPICTVMSNAGNKLASQAVSVHKIKMHICKRVT